MKPENKKMADFLKKNGIDATPKYIADGSMRGTWRLYKKGATFTNEIREKLTLLGFVDFDGESLHRFSGNGGAFQVFVRANPETIKTILA